MQNPAAPPQPPAPGMPMPPPVWGAPPTPAKSRRAILAAAVIAVVVILVLAVVLVFVVLAPSRPTVQLGAPYSPYSGSFLVNVTSVNQAVPISSVRVNLQVGGVSGQPSSLTPYPSYPGLFYAFVNVSAEGYVVGLEDQNNDSAVSVSDVFEVARLYGSFTGPVTLQLLWSDGYVVGSVTYAPTGSGGKPQLTVTSSDPVATNAFRFSIAGASQSRPISSFRVNILVGTTPGTAVTLAPSMAFTVSGLTYTVAYTDIGSEGDLTAGDIFTMTENSGDFVLGTTYHVLILWSDGSQLADAAYAA